MKRTLRRSLVALPFVLLAVGCPQLLERSSRRTPKEFQVVEACVAIDGDSVGVIAYGDRVGRVRLLNLDEWSSPGGYLDDGYERVVEGVTAGFDLRLHYPSDHTLRLVLLDSDQGVDAESGRLLSARVPPGGSWFDAAVEIDPGPVARGAVDLAGEPAGAALLAWEHDGWILAAGAAPGADFVAPRVLHDEPDPWRASAPVAALGASGAAAVAYAVARFDGTREIRIHRSDALGDFLPAERLDGARDAASPRLALSADGGVTVAWVQERLDGSFEIAARRFDPALGWQAEERVAALLDRSAFFELFVDGSGTATIAWSEEDDRAVRIARRAPGADWSQPQVLGLGVPPPSSAPFDLAGADGGDFIVAAIPSLYSGYSGYGPLGVRFTPSLGASPGHPLLDEKTVETVGAIDVDTGTRLGAAVWVVDGGVFAHTWAPFELWIDVEPDPPIEHTTALVSHVRLGGATTGALQEIEWDLDGDGSVDETLAEFDHPFGAAGDIPFTCRVLDSWGYEATTTRTIYVERADDDDGGGGGDGPPWLLTVEVSGLGTVESSPLGIHCPSDCDEPFDDGTYVVLTPTAGAGWTFDAWEGDIGAGFDSDDEDLGVEGARFWMRSARTITARFVPEP